MFSPDTIKVKLKDKARELGFLDLRICSATDFSKIEAQKFRAWLDAGFFDKMEYLKRAEAIKISPQKFLPDAKSAICICASFWRKSDERRIALYAQGKDYHDVIKPKLIELSKILEEIGEKTRVSVDASPLWEKLLAARAGVGWIGKNTLITRSDNGSWQFLAIILTTAELPFDSPIDNRCGTCQKCVQACPTSAITKCGIDTRKCISNLTIERKEPLNKEEIKMVGDKFFGCDECLRACPFGANAKMTTIPEFTTTINLPEKISDKELLTLFSETPIFRKLKRKY